MISGKFIPLMVPDIQQQDIDAVVDVLRSGNLVQGEKVLELEENIAGYLGVKHAVAVSNGTATLLLALIANGIGAGDEVIVPALSFIASANVVELAGAKPVFVDIDLNTFNIDVSLIEQAITPRTRAIMPVHEFGLACDIDAICSLAQKYNLIVIEDAACALGAKINNRFAGTMGDVASFSFHPRKAITSGEGGIVVTFNDDLAAKMRILRNHGIEVQDQKMEFTHAGFNFRLTDFQAALVNSQLIRIDDILNQKNELAKIYFEELTMKHIQLPACPKDYKHSWQSFHILLDDPIDRDFLISRLREKGIGTNYGAQCIPAQKFYKQKYPFDVEKLFPNALRAFRQGLVLPLYGHLQPDEIRMIASILQDTIQEHYA